MNDELDENGLQEEEVDEDIPQAMCPACGLANPPMGTLGDMLHYRCRACGMDYARRHEPDA